MYNYFQHILLKQMIKHKNHNASVKAGFEQSESINHDINYFTFAKLLTYNLFLHNNFQKYNTYHIYHTFLY